MRGISDGNSLGDKILFSREIIRNTYLTAKNPYVCFSGGKKSVVLLHLLNLECGRRLNVLNLQTGSEFSNIASFAEKLRRLWQFNLIQEPVLAGANSLSLDASGCSCTLIGSSLADIAERYAIDCLITGEVCEEPDLKRLCDIPVNLRRSPLYHFNEMDIWNYLKMYNLPTCSLYGQGYLKVDCTLCTIPPDSGGAKDPSAKQELQLKEQLKKLGYL